METAPSEHDPPQHWRPKTAAPGPTKTRQARTIDYEVVHRNDLNMDPMVGKRRSLGLDEERCERDGRMLGRRRGRASAQERQDEFLAFLKPDRAIIELTRTQQNARRVDRPRAEKDRIES